MVSSLWMGAKSGLYIGATFSLARSLEKYMSDMSIGALLATLVSPPTAFWVNNHFPTRFRNFTLQQRCESAKNSFITSVFFTAAFCATADATLNACIGRQTFSSTMSGYLINPVARAALGVAYGSLPSVVPLVGGALGACIGFLGNQSAPPPPPVMASS